MSELNLSNIMMSPSKENQIIPYDMLQKPPFVSFSNMLPILPLEA